MTPRRMSFRAPVPLEPQSDVAPSTGAGVAALVILAAFAGIGFHAVARFVAQHLGWVA
jgi:hypothetical protein